MPLMPRVRATKGSLFSAWNGSESSFACCHCQEIASVVHSASFSSSNSSSDIELHVSLAVNQMFRSFTCDLRKCESPWCDLHGWLNIKHPSTFFLQEVTTVYGVAKTVARKQLRSCFHTFKPLEKMIVIYIFRAFDFIEVFLCITFTTLACM